MKRFLSLLISFALYFTAFANDEILLLADEPPENFEIQPSRSTDPSVTAFIDELTISLDLSVLADCEYSVKDCTTQCPADGKLVSCFVNIHDLMMPNNEQLEIKSYVSTKIDGLFYVSDEATLGVNTPLIYRE